MPDDLLFLLSIMFVLSQIKNWFCCYTASSWERVKKLSKDVVLQVKNLKPIQQAENPHADYNGAEF